MTGKTIRVLCVDDHEFLADGLNSRLGLERDMEFAGWQGQADGLPGEIERTQADVVLLDIDMPGADPFEALADLKRIKPDVHVIMLSAFVKDHFIDAALDAGAWGYVSKSDDPDAVIAAIRKVSRGEFAFGPKVLERRQPVLDGKPGTRRPSSKLSNLTPRELQVLRMLGKGMTRVEIAESLHRSPKTIDNHRAAIMEKLQINDRVELARFAIREDLTDL